MIIGDDEEVITVLVDHPDWEGQQIRLDAVEEDLIALPDAENIVLLTVGDRRYPLTILQFNELFGDRDSEAVLEEALAQQQEEERDQPTKTRKRQPREKK